VKRLLLQAVGFLLFGFVWLLGALVSISTGSRLDWMPTQVNIIAVPISWVSSKVDSRVVAALAFFVGMFFVALAIARFISLLRRSAKVTART
jgi:hypothetical protein